ncbi:MAG TPA: hypothetical protein VGG16_08285 [Streptosporangiaceae bacterium]
MAEGGTTGQRCNGAMGFLGLYRMIVRVRSVFPERHAHDHRELPGWLPILDGFARWRDQQVLKLDG